MTKSELYAKRQRAIKTARTYIRKAEAMQMLELPADPAYWEFCEVLLEAAFEILRHLPADYFETTQAESYFGLPGGPVNFSDTPQETVEKITALLERRRSQAKKLNRIKLLEAVEGRSPEEAKVYLAKAAELRSTV